MSIWFIFLGLRFLRLKCSLALRALPPSQDNSSLFSHLSQQPRFTFLTASSARKFPDYSKFSCVFYSALGEYVLKPPCSKHKTAFLFIATEEEFPTLFSITIPRNSVGKESSCNAEDPGLIPGWERYPGEGNGNPLQYSCLENPMYRGAWQATVHGIARIIHDFAIKPQPLISGLFPYILSLAFFFFFRVQMNFLLWYNSHVIKFILLKYVIQWF